MQTTNAVPRKEFSRSLGAACTVLAVSVVLAFVFPSAANAGDKYKTLHRFHAPGGNKPIGGLIFDSTGNLYGTTSQGGNNNCCGNVFKLIPNGDGTWKEQVIHSFHGADGADPRVSLISDSAGNLYGTTSEGGNNNGGTVFELMPNADGTWTEKVLHSFNLNLGDGSYPVASLIFDSAGNLYGTTWDGGSGGHGTAFELTPQEDGTWKESVLYAFSGGADGGDPEANLVFDSAGNLYGTTGQGGTKDHGVVFELINHGGTWTEQVIHTFRFVGTDGGYPTGGLIFDSTGNLYGTTLYGGVHGGGIVFKLTPNKGGTWTESVLHEFPNSGTDGASPAGGLIYDSVGNLYGTTFDGGFFGWGTVFSLTPNSKGGWRETQLHSFSRNPGATPLGGVVRDPQGNLFGTTSGGFVTLGSVFEVSH